MPALPRTPWIPAAILVAALYAAVGLAFAEFGRRASSDQMHVTWNRLAFLTSAVAFAVHFAYEHFRLANPPLITAAHLSLAVGLGALGLALAANIHELGSAPAYRPRMLIALVAWPAVTALPAFVVALVPAAALRLMRRTT